MKAFFEWLTGLKSIPEGEIQELHIDFLLLPENNGFVLTFILAIGVAVFSWWIYRKRGQTLGYWRWGLCFFRFCALMLLLLLLLGPVLRMVTHDVRKSIIAVLADSSRSMSISDRKASMDRIRKNGIALGHTRLRDKGVSVDASARKKIEEAGRIDILRNVLEDEETGLIPVFTEKYRILNFTFGEKLRSGGENYTGWIESIRADGKATALGTAIEKVLDDTRGDNVAGIVVLTDGSNNAGVDPGQVTETAGKRGVPCYFIGIGEPDVKDIQITFLAMRDIMFAGDPAPVTVKIRHWGCGGMEVPLVVSDNRGEVKRKKIVLNQTGEQTETVIIKPERKGEHLFNVKVGPLAEELIQENNKKEKLAKVIDEKIKVLWVETSPRWEYRYAKNLMVRDKKRFDPNVLLYETEMELRESSPLFAKNFPRNKKELFQYHLVVLGDIDSVNLSETQMTLVRKYVSEEGGAVIFMPGRRFGPAQWKDTPLEKVLPVITGTRKSMMIRKQDEFLKPLTVPYRAKQTHIGDRHPLLYISEKREETRKAWEKYLVIYNVMKVEKARPGAQVLLETSEPTPVPLIVYSRYGSGTVLYLGTDELWRWRYRPGPISHDRFWGSVLEQIALARLLGGSRKITLQVSREELGVGEQQTINARVLGDNFQPAVEETLNAILTRDTDGEKKIVELRSIGSGTGLYEAKHSPGKIGNYKLELAYAGDNVSVSFRVVESQVEYENPSLDRTLLETWAAKAGGNVYDPWDLSGLPGEISAKAKQSLIRTEDELWDAPLWLILFILLAGSEWFIRKRNNLP